MFCRFWKKKCEHCPETRVEMAKQKMKQKSEISETNKKVHKHQRKLFAENGQPYSFNEPKVHFRFEDFMDSYILDIHIFK